MNNSILKNSRIRFFSLTLALASVISLGIFMQSCSKDDEKPLDEAILNSTELEEFIIAGADFQKSLAIFTSELSKVNFSELEVSYDAEGRKNMRFPTGTVSVRIEEKGQTFNEKKNALRKKFPQLSSLREEVEKKYFQQCIQNSVNVSAKLLELGINTFRPKLKSGIELGGENESYLNWLMYNWYNSSNFLEIVILIYANGNFELYFDPRNSYDPTTGVYTSYSPPMTSTNGNIYYSSNQVVGIAHTHPGNNAPSTYPQGHPLAGQISEGIIGGIPNYTYTYSNGFWCYYNCD